MSAKPGDKARRLARLLAFRATMIAKHGSEEAWRLHQQQIASKGGQAQVSKGRNALKEAVQPKRLTFKTKQAKREYMQELGAIGGKATVPKGFSMTRKKIKS